MSNSDFGINEPYLLPENVSTEVSQEITQGLALIKQIEQPIASVFGTHKVHPSDKLYRLCVHLCARLAEKNYAILTAGGGGIMKAANTGAFSVSGVSIALQGTLLRDEKPPATLFTHQMEFRYLFVRDFLRQVKSKFFLFFPGAFGTNYELFEYANLINKGILEPRPIICVGKEHWSGLIDWMGTAVEKKFLSAEALASIKIVDSIEEIFEILE